MAKADKLRQQIENLKNQLKQEEAKDRQKQRRLRNRQMIIEAGTMRAALERGETVSFSSIADYEFWLRQHVVGSSNRLTMGYESGGQMPLATPGKTMQRKAAGLDDTQPQPYEMKKPNARKAPSVSSHHGDMHTLTEAKVKADSLKKHRLNEGVSQEELVKEFNL